MSNGAKADSILSINIVEMGGKAQAFITTHPEKDKTADSLGLILVHAYNAMVTGDVEHARAVADLVVGAAEGVKKAKGVDRG